MPRTEQMSTEKPSGQAAQLREELASLKIDRSRPRRKSAWALLAWFLAAIVLLGGIGGAGYWALHDRLFPLPRVKVETARVMTLNQVRTELTATGYLESRWQAAVGAKVPGRIAQIPVEEGDRVETGDVLAELEHADLDAALASRKVQVALAESQLTEAETTLAQAQRDVERERDLFARKAGTRSSLEQAETAFQAATAARRSRQVAIEAAQSAVLEAEEAVRNMFIFAPFAGTVVTKDAEQGESIMPGGMGASSGRGSVITLAKLDELEVDTDVKEDYLSQLRKGQPAEIVVDAAPDHRYRGRLREIIPMGDRTRGIVKVKVTVLDPDERLFPELSATVNFLPDADQEETLAEVAEKGVFVPVSALQGTGESRYVWMVTKDRILKRAIATIGEPSDGLVRVSGDLSGGENLVIEGPDGLKEGDQVQTQE